MRGVGVKGAGIYFVYLVNLVVLKCPKLSTACGRVVIKKSGGRGRVGSARF